MGKWLLVIDKVYTTWVNSVTGIRVVWIDNRQGRYDGGRYGHRVSMVVGMADLLVWEGTSPDPAEAIAFLRDTFGIEADGAAQCTSVG